MVMWVWENLDLMIMNIVCLEDMMLDDFTTLLLKQKVLARLA